MRERVSRKKKVEDFSHIPGILKEVFVYIEKHKSNTFAVSHFPYFRKISGIEVHYLSFIVFAKTIPLKVNSVVNNSVFQPYETTDDKKYCVLSVLQVGECDEYPEYIDELRKIGCRLYKFCRVEEVFYVLNGIK